MMMPQSKEFLYAVYRLLWNHFILKALCRETGFSERWQMLQSVMIDCDDRLMMACLENECYCVPLVQILPILGT